MTKLSKTGLALSGGGFRATLYALGSLIRMNDDGLLTEIDTITAVSGSAITAGYLMLKWEELEFQKLNVANRKKAINFREVIVDPLLEFCDKKITNRRQCFINTLIPWTNPVNEVRKKYESFLFGKTKLKDIPSLNNAPQFVFYGTNLDTGVSVRINKDYFRDYHIGYATDHDITLAQAVSISSGFPPFFSPIKLDGRKWNWKNSPYQKLDPKVINILRERILLCDGGLYDNMGLEMLWKYDQNQEYGTVFSCDAGALFSIPWVGPFKAFHNWIGQFLRMSDIMINQQRALRKRILVRNYLEKVYKGSYWSIDNQISEDYSFFLSNNIGRDYETLYLLDTQLQTFGKNINSKLVNLGFIHADESLRKWHNNLSKPQKLPLNVV